MSAAEIITEIEQVGGEIWTDGDRLKFRDTPARLVPLIREHKAALLALLKDAPQSSPPAQAGPNVAPRWLVSLLSQLWPRNRHQRPSLVGNASDSSRAPRRWG